jgi:cytochrome c-type biogenesis protein CcmH/NrfG
MIYILFILLLIIVLALLLWPVRQDVPFCASVGGLSFIAVFAFYGFAGSPQILPLLEERDSRIAALKTSMRTNSEIVKSDPKNLRAWVALGQDFLETGQWEAAVNALKQAVTLSNGDPKLILAYAKAQILVAEGKVTDEAKKSLQMVLVQDKENEDARYYLAVRQLQDGNTKEAMKSMKSLYQSLPETSPLKTVIDKQIGKAD